MGARKKIERVLFLENGSSDFDDKKKYFIGFQNVIQKLSNHFLK